MHGHKVLCLALVCITEGEASRAGSLFPPAHTNAVCMCAIWTRKWDRVCWLASGSEIRFSLTAPSDWITQQTIRFAWSEDKQASWGVKGCYLSDEVRSKATWCNTISHTVVLFDRPLPFAAGNKSQFHHLPSGRWTDGQKMKGSRRRECRLCGHRKEKQHKTITKSKMSGTICFRF